MHHLSDAMVFLISTWRCRLQLAIDSLALISYVIFFIELLTISVYRHSSEKNGKHDQQFSIDVEKFFETIHRTVSVIGLGRDLGATLVADIRFRE